jgi:hypothetical protein
MAALVEHFDGRLEILDWSKERDFSPLEAYRGAPEAQAAAPSHAQPNAEPNG